MPTLKLWYSSMVMQDEDWNPGVESRYRPTKFRTLGYAMHININVYSSN